MTYYESAEDVFIPEQRVTKELEDHGIPHAEIKEFFRDVKPTDAGLWHAQAVLAWLGY